MTTGLDMIENERKIKNKVKFEPAVGDYFQLDDYGCININHINVISGRKWGTDKLVPMFNLLIIGTNFKHLSNCIFTGSELASEIVRVMDIIDTHQQGDTQ